MDLRPAAWACAALLLVSACAEQGGEAPSAPPIAGEWELVEGTAEGAPLPMPPDVHATLVIADGELSGRSFCNLYSATYRLGDDGGLRIDGLGGTEMGCDPEVMAAESAYLAALGAATGRPSVADGGLVLTGEGVQLRFREIPPEPRSDLVGTRWVLDTLIDGETASSTVGEPAFLELAPDLTATGSTGCRTFTATWSEDGGTLRFPQFEASGDCPGDVARQNAHVLAVLGRDPQVQIDGDRLTLTASDGRALSYRADG
jgi:heat shock protein HslJ